MVEPILHNRLQTVPGGIELDSTTLYVRNLPYGDATFCCRCIIDVDRDYIVRELETPPTEEFCGLGVTTWRLPLATTTRTTT